MSNSLQYEGNGQYKAHLESGEVIITSDEIYELVRALSKQEVIPTIIEEFPHREVWWKIIPRMSASIQFISTKLKLGVESSNMVETEVEEIADNAIASARRIALKYYKENYIIIGKEG